MGRKRRSLREKKAIQEAQRQAALSVAPTQDTWSSWWKRIRVDFIAALLAAGFGGVVTYLSLEAKYDRALEKISVQQKDIDRVAGELKQAQADLKNALAQQAILNHLGPNVLSFQRLTVGQNGNATQVHLGRCPDFPCYTVKYEGAETKWGEPILKWLVNGEGLIGSTIVKRGDNLFDFPARALCYGKISVASNQMIMLILEKIIDLNTFDVTVGLVKTPASIPSPSTLSDLMGDSGCFKE